MKGMIDVRRIIGFLIPVFVVCGGAWFWYDQNYGTTDYYTKIVQEGKRVDIGSGGGMEQYRYSYHLPSYTKDNHEKTLSFNSAKDKELKPNSYLVLHVNDKKGVMGWEEVKPSDVPASVLHSLDK